MSAPKRIQLRRTKGWRKPEGAIVVSRPSKWGNPIKVVPEWMLPERRKMYRVVGSPLSSSGGGPVFNGVDVARRTAASTFKWDLLNGRLGDLYPTIEQIVDSLAGRDLACWCPTRQHPNGRLIWGDCHADVLLEVANS